MRGALVAVVALVSCVWAPVAWAQDAVLLSGSYFNELEAAGDRLVMTSGPGFEGPFVFAALQMNNVVPLPQARSRVAVDVDYGVIGGRERLIYKRCARRLCDLYRFDFATEREAKLARLSRSRCSESQPELDGTTIVFARDGGRSCRPGVYAARAGAAPRRILSSTDVEEVELDGGVVVVSAFVGKRPVWGLYKLPATGGKPKVITRGGGNPDRTPPGLHAEELSVAEGVAWWTRGEDNEFTTDWALRKTPIVGGRCDERYFEDQEITALTVLDSAPVIGIEQEVRRLGPTGFTAVDC